MFFSLSFVRQAMTFHCGNHFFCVEWNVVEAVASVSGWLLHSHVPATLETTIFSPASRLATQVSRPTLTPTVSRVKRARMPSIGSRHRLFFRRCVYSGSSRQLPFEILPGAIRDGFIDGTLCLRLSTSSFLLFMNNGRRVNFGGVRSSDYPPARIAPGIEDAAVRRRRRFGMCTRRVTFLQS